MMDEENGLVEKLRKIEALYARPGTEGERLAAGAAIDRIRYRLDQIKLVEPAIEYRFSMPDPWSRSLFGALLRRYGLKPYRYSGQRRTTVMVKVARKFVDETLWPEYLELNATLRGHLEDVTRRVIATAICRDVSEPEERTKR